MALLRDLDRTHCLLQRLREGTAAAGGGGGGGVGALDAEGAQYVVLLLESALGTSGGGGEATAGPAAAAGAAATGASSSSSSSSPPPPFVAPDAPEVSGVRELFPDLGVGFVQRCLGAFLVREDCPSLEVAAERTVQSLFGEQELPASVDAGSGAAGRGEGPVSRAQYDAAVAAARRTARASALGRQTADMSRQQPQQHQQEHLMAQAPVDTVAAAAEARRRAQQLQSRPQPHHQEPEKWATSRLPRSAGEARDMAVAREAVSLLDEGKADADLRKRMQAIASAYDAATYDDEYDDQFDDVPTFKVSRSLSDGGGGDAFFDDDDDDDDEAKGAGAADDMVEMSAEEVAAAVVYEGRGKAMAAAVGAGTVQDIRVNTDSYVPTAMVRGPDGKMQEVLLPNPNRLPRCVYGEGMHAYLVCLFVCCLPLSSFFVLVFRPHVVTTL